jgi:hypothetical protein
LASRSHAASASRTACDRLHDALGLGIGLGHA